VFTEVKSDGVLKFFRYISHFVKRFPDVYYELAAESMPVEDIALNHDIRHYK